MRSMKPTNEDAVRAARTLRKAASAALLAVLGATLAQCADQPRPHCITTPAPFAVRLIEQPGGRSAGCDATFGPDSFNAEPVVGLTAYFAKDGKGQPNYDQGTVAIKTAEVGNLTGQYETQHAALGDSVPPGTTATDGKVFSIGAFTAAESDDSDLCYVPTMTGQTHLVLAPVPAVPDDPTTTEDESAPPLPAVDIKLDWSNVRILVTAAMYGTEFEATVVDTRPTPAGGTCAITYRAVGISNAVSCAGETAGTVNPDLCNPIPNPAEMRFTNNGISPLAKQSCDPDIGWCLIPADAPFPALN